MSFFGFLFVVIVAMVYSVQQYTIWTMFVELEREKKHSDHLKPPF